MRSLVRHICVAGVLGVLLTAGVASAQPQQGGAPSQGPDLAAILHLRPDQQAAYHSFRAAMSPPPAMLAQFQTLSGRMSAARTPERLDIMSQVQQLQTSNFNRTAEATRRFYAQLSPDQQRTFDQLTGPRGSGQGAPPQH